MRLRTVSWSSTRADWPRHTSSARLSSEWTGATIRVPVRVPVVLCDGGARRTLTALDPPARGISMTCGWDELGPLPKSEWRHATVYSFVFVCAHQVRLVPDAHVGPAFGHSLIERDPRGPMQPVGTALVGLQ